MDKRAVEARQSSVAEKQILVCIEKRHLYSGSGVSFRCNYFLQFSLLTFLAFLVDIQKYQLIRPFKVIGKLLDGINIPHQQLSHGIQISLKNNHLTQVFHDSGKCYE